MSMTGRDYEFIAEAIASVRRRYNQEGIIGEATGSALDYLVKYLAYYWQGRRGATFNTDMFKHNARYCGNEDMVLDEPPEQPKRKQEVFPVDAEFIKKLGYPANREAIDELCDALSGQFTADMVNYAKEWLQKQKDKAS